VANIQLVRIDERMIHGQVVTQWLRNIHCDRILLVDDGVFADEFLKKVVVMAAPADVAIEVLTVDMAADSLKSDKFREQALMILVRHPSTVEALVGKGIKITKLNLGGMGTKPGRKRLFKNIAISSEEAEIFKRLAANGVVTTIQMTPNEKPVDLMAKI
jgi:mannose/fructose/N-acetylgalactosamine-specific phosphotransferase system component IIB